MPGAAARVAWAATTSSRPLPASSPTESRPTRGRATPSTASLKAAPRKANWTRCWARTSTLAPTSRKSTGLPGTGSRTASAGRCTPFRRLRPKVAAAIVAPVEPWLTSASALPLGDVAGGAHDRGLGPGAHRGHRVLLVADRLLGRHHLDPLGPVEAELPGRAEDADPDPVGGGGASALGQSLEALLGAEPVEGDGGAVPGRHYSSVSGVPAGRCGTEWLITSRPA